jgi:hypothetical protein
VFSPEPVARNLKKAVTTTSNGETSNISIESIGTPKDTYQRYQSIESTKNGKKSDFNKVYNLWLHNGGSSSDDPTLFNDAIFGALLYGNLPSAERAKTITYLHGAYKTDFSSTKKETKNNRKVYTYTLTVNLHDYAKAAQLLAKTMGLPSASQINPDSYKPTDTIGIKATVDVLSREVRNITYSSGGATEEYSSYGVLAEVKKPTKTVKYEELQKAVQEASK